MQNHTGDHHVVLQPGEYFVGDHPHRITTLLGSCVSITIWHPNTCFGAMSHSLLPSREGRSNQEPDARYGDEAMSLMLRALQKRGISPKQCQAKIFGGGSMFSCQAQHDDIGIGKRNGMAAEHIVKSHGIQLISTSLYGSGYRRIIFDLSTGHVWSRLTSISERFPTG